MGKAVGIDLGTTNSAVAIVEAGKPVIIVNAEGDRITPSVVAFTKDNRSLGGHPGQAAVHHESRSDHIFS